MKLEVPLNIHKYKPQTAKVLPWSVIEQRYNELYNLDWQIKSVLDLIQHIFKTKLSDRLFAFTSMHKLVVGINNPMEWNREALHIEFDVQTQTWFFKYYSKPNEPIEFERKYPVDKGIEKFDGLMKMLRW